MLYIGVYIADRVSYINKLNLPNKNSVTQKRYAQL